MGSLAHDVRPTGWRALAFLCSWIAGVGPTATSRLTFDGYGSHPTRCRTSRASANYCSSSRSGRGSLAGVGAIDFAARCQASTAERNRSGSALGRGLLAELQAMNRRSNRRGVGASLATRLSCAGGAGSALLRRGDNDPYPLGMRTVHRVRLDSSAHLSLIKRGCYATSSSPWSLAAVPHDRWR